MTKREYFEILRAAYPTSADNYDEVIAFIDHELELLAKKNSGPRKPTARQNENELIKEAIITTLDPDVVYFAADIKAAVPALADVSPQRVGGILRQMVLAGTMLSDIEKGKKRYQLA